MRQTSRRLAGPIALPLLAALSALAAGCATPEALSVPSALPGSFTGAPDLPPVSPELVSPPSSLSSLEEEGVIVRAGNDSETTILRERGDGIWEELAVATGAVRFTFQEVSRENGRILLIDNSRNGGLSLRLDMARGVIDLSEGAGEPFYQRYTIRTVE